jgi:hypothetical protein
MGQFSRLNSSGGLSVNDKSNLFVFNSAASTANNYDPSSTTPATAAMMNASTIASVDDSAFQAVRPGPILMKIEYVGRLDIAAGTLTGGVAYSNAGNATDDAISFDNSYTTISFLEDTSYSKTVPATDSLRIVYVPHDYTCFNLKLSTDASSLITQRAYFIISGSPGNTPAPGFRVTIVQNWEAIPKPRMADILTTSYNLSCPAGFEGKEVLDFIMKNNLIVNREDRNLDRYDLNQNFQVEQ